MNASDDEPISDHRYEPVSDGHHNLDFIQPPTDIAHNTHSYRTAIEHSRCVYLIERKLLFPSYLFTLTALLVSSQARQQTLRNNSRVSVSPSSTDRLTDPSLSLPQRTHRHLWLPP